MIFFLQYWISEWTRMLILEHFRYRNDVFQSDIFVSDIGIRDFDVGFRISPTLRSMSMPTYGYNKILAGLSTTETLSTEEPFSWAQYLMVPIISTRWKGWGEGRRATRCYWWSQAHSWISGPSQTYTQLNRVYNYFVTGERRIKPIFICTGNTPCTCRE
jgi:hypothetical protein